MHIFFDVDGVLIDGFHTKPEKQNRWDKALKEDLGIDPADMQEIFSGWFLEVLQGRLGFEEELDRWLKQNDYDLKAWQVIKYWHEKDSNINRALYNIVEQLSALNGVNLYIATNQTHERAQYLWNNLGFKNHFKDIYYSARLGCLKYDTHYFAQIEADLNLDPIHDTILYFDDHPKNIEVAAERGWKAVLFDHIGDVENHPEIIRMIQTQERQ